jgi:hypothetical protein
VRRPSVIQCNDRPRETYGANMGRRDGFKPSRETNIARRFLTSVRKQPAP